MKPFSNPARYSIAAGLLACLLAACSAPPGISPKRSALGADWSALGASDRTRAFAASFCRAVAEDRRFSVTRCSDWLWQPPAGRDDAASGQPRAVRQRTLVIIPGIFGECVSQWVRPYSSEYAALQARGYRVLVVPVEGRASAARNAATIHRHLVKADLRDAVVVAYSKGLTDFLLAASQPQAAAWRDKVDVLVSVAGSAQGAHIATRTAALYRGWLMAMPLEACGPADGGVVLSVAPDEAKRITAGFLAAQPPFATYSVVSVAPENSANPWLVPFRAVLSAVDRRNDGQMVMQDAVLPGSTVLAVVRADHWSVALPFEDSADPRMRLLAHGNAFPRGALIRAVLEFTAPVESVGLSRARAVGE